MWAATRSLLELGGPVVAVLMTISVFGFAIAIYKFFQFSTLSPGRFQVLHNALDKWQDSQEQCLAQLEKARLGLGRIMKFGLDHRDAPETEELREELARQATNFLQPYARYLRPLELIYYLAPVLGLLGTVLGMIEAFRGLESSSGLDKDSTALAGGIWEALLTTAVGLSIAIPFTVVHAWLETRLDNATAQVSDLLTRVMTINVGSK
jgi:biopolymer transport protein ExbB